MLCRFVSSFDGTVRYRFAQLVLYDSRRCTRAPKAWRLGQFEETLSAAGTTARKVSLSSLCFFRFQSGTRAHTPTRPRSSGNGTVPGAQGCTTLGIGSLRGSAAANFFPRRWGHTHATENIGDQCSCETIFCDGISDECESSFSEPRHEYIYIPRAMSAICDDFPCRDRVLWTKSLVMRNLNECTTTCSFGRMPGFPLDTAKSKDSSRAIDQSRRPRGCPYPRNFSPSYHRLSSGRSSSSFTSSRTRGTRINHASILCVLVGRRLLLSFRGHSARVTWTSPKINSWSHPLSGNKYMSFIFRISVTSLWVFATKYQYSWQRNWRRDRS